MTAINVQFPSDPETWNIVVDDANSDEEPYIWYDGMIYFIASYQTREHFNCALDRFNGTVAYSEVTVH